MYFTVISLISNFSKFPFFISKPTLLNDWSNSLCFAEILEPIIEFSSKSKLKSVVIVPEIAQPKAVTSFSSEVALTLSPLNESSRITSPFTFFIL